MPQTCGEPGIRRAVRHSIGTHGSVAAAPRRGAAPHFIPTREPHAMKRISSKWTFFYKRIFPVILLGFLLLFVTAALATQRSANAPPAALFFLVAVFMAVIGFFIFRKLIFDLVDEVL